MSDAPADWLISHAGWLPLRGEALDVACGRGRHALWLAARGLRVMAVDRHAEAIAELKQLAATQMLPVVAEVLDLESGDPDLGTERFDVIVVINYLHRPLLPTLLKALRPGGVLIYETFTRDQAKRGKPSNPAFLLEPGELAHAVEALNVVAIREGDMGDRSIASIVALKPHRVQRDGLA